VESLEIVSEKKFQSIVSWGGLNKQFKTIPKGRYFCIIDKNAEWFFNRSISKYIDCCSIFSIDPSEKDKSQDKANEIIEFLLNNNADRDSVIISVGGGVTSDLSGYVASIYKRGVPWISIPTTLLAQVDASVGGKTAINTKYGKNVIGAFYPPNNVIMSHEPSEGWSEEIWLEGLAEMIKIFLVFCPDLAYQFKDNGTRDFSDELTQKSVELKADVVKVDPWENHLRAALNYGHTFGHAIEHNTEIRHGIAVSMGIRIANRVAVNKGIMKEDKASEIDALLDELEFPELYDLPTFEEILPSIMQDKKNVSNEVMMVLIDGINAIDIEPKKITFPVSLDELNNGYNKAIEINK